MKRHGSVAATLLLVALAGAVTHAQLRKQARDGGPIQALTAAERAALGDPLFTLLLKTAPAPTTLDAIEQKLIGGAADRRRLFVVHEESLDPTRPGARRAVLTYKGTTAPAGSLQPNIALSLSFTDTGFSTEDIEAWGWDDRNSRYNYYKLDRQGGESGLSWKFRGSSVGADALTAAGRANTCMRCHINGGPVMKELPLPWNNWHSFKSLLPYLDGLGNDDWPIAASPRFRSLAEAQTFETDIILPSIRQFNGRRVKALVRAVPAGGSQATDAKRLLRPLFTTTEYNVISAEQPSGLHPFPALGTGPPNDIEVPDTFFLNANLLAGAGFAQYRGLGIPEARQFASTLTITPQEYVSLVRDTHTTVGGKDFDSMFAWFVPEPSHIDNHLVDILVRDGVITAEFAASVLAVDLETPVFSAARESLLRFVPATFRFTPRGPDDVPTPHPDALTTTVIQAIRAAGTPPVDSPEATLLALLEDAQPLARVREKVQAYVTRQRTALTGAGRDAELKRLYARMLERRKAAQVAVPALVESPFLFPTIPGQ